MPHVMLLGQTGIVMELSLNRDGEPVYEVQLNNGQRMQFYEGELKEIPGPDTVERGTRAMPDWAENPETLQEMLQYVNFMGASFDETFQGLFPNEEAVVRRIEELRGVDFNGGDEEELPPI